MITFNILHLLSIHSHLSACHRVKRGSSPQSLSPTQSPCVLKLATTLPPKKNLGPAIPFQDSRTSGFQFPDLCFSQTFLFSCRIINSCWIQASYLLSSTNQQPQHQVVPSFLIFLACQLPGICRGNRQPPITPRNPPWTAWTTPGPWIFTTSDFVIAIAWNKSDRTPKTMNKC